MAPSESSPSSARVVVITGASGGIGEALARVLASGGASLALVARRTDELRRVADAIGGGHTVLTLSADVTRRREVEGAVADAQSYFGHIDVWVNNAGRGISQAPSALTDDDIDEMVRVNVKSALYGMQAVLPHFKTRGTGQVVNISSMLGRVPYVAHRSAYSGAKHFLNALTANFRTEVQETHPGIQFTIVSPGVVRTEFGVNARHGGHDSRQIPMSQSPEEVAAVIADAIDSRRPDVYTREGARARVAEYYAMLGEDP